MERILHELVHPHPALDQGDHRGDPGIPDLPDPDNGPAALYLFPVLGTGLISGTYLNFFCRFTDRDILPIAA